MSNVKTNKTVKLERRLPFQPVVNLTLDERIITSALKSNPKKVELTADVDGNILVDKEKNPELYDWAVNGSLHFVL
jgi:hypothetical protein